jgi:hypothetical protein
MPDKNPHLSVGRNLLKSVAGLVPVLLAVLLAGAIYFYKQRMLFIDAPHILFRIINDGELQITEHRYGSFITQLVPWLGAKMHLSLRIVTILYSASFYMFFLTVALLLVYKFRNYGLAILFGLYLTLFASDTFYWPNNEVHQGIAWLFLAFALNFSVANKETSRLLKVLLFAASFFLAIWTHPLVMLVMVYLWFFYWLDKSSWPYSRAESFVYTGILLALSYCKFYQGQHHGYDSCKIEIVTQFHPGQIKAIFSSPQLHFFIKSCLTNYWLFVVLFVAGLVGLIWKKKYLLLLLTVFFAAGYLVLLTITFWDGHSPRFYIESEYMPLSIICCAPFAYFVLPRLRVKVAVVAVVLVFLIRLGYIYGAAAPFIKRVEVLAMINGKMKQKEITKAIITEQGKSIDSLLFMNWALPVESMLFSQLSGENPGRTCIFLTADEMQRFNTASRDTMLGCYEKRPASRINSLYFKMDTVQVYKVISLDSLMN